MFSVIRWNEYAKMFKTASLVKRNIGDRPQVFTLYKADFYVDAVVINELDEFLASVQY